MALCEACLAALDRGRFPADGDLARLPTAIEQRILDVLYGRLGHWVSCDSLRALLYSPRAIEPARGYFSVYVSRLRRRVLRGSRWRIETGVYGTASYRLVER